MRICSESARQQVTAMSDELGSWGMGRGERVASVLPNGLPAVVSFLAASIAGTAAPLNPGYREDEFSFFLEDTKAKVSSAPPPAPTLSPRPPPAAALPGKPPRRAPGAWAGSAGPPARKKPTPPPPPEPPLAPP